LEKRWPAFAENRNVCAQEPDEELMLLITKFVLPDPKEAVMKDPAVKKESGEPGEPAATGKRGAEAGKAATTSKRARS
jgi:hypothetical protein